jgi:hypothetical protein
MAYAWFEDKWFIDHCECEAGYVTHWMELPDPPKDGESGILDYKAVECLKAVQTITKYLDDEEQSCGCTYWIDKKGYSFGTDIGYFFEGLERFESYLIKRLRRAVIVRAEGTEWDQRRCTICGDVSCCQRNYCPNCGAKMDGDGDAR